MKLFEHIINENKKILIIILIYMGLTILQITLLFKISEDYMFICNRNDLTNAIKYDCSDADIFDFKFTAKNDYGNFTTRMCVILDDDDFPNDKFIAYEMKRLSTSTDDYSPEDLSALKEYDYNQFKKDFPELDLELDDIVSYGFGLTDDIQLTHLGLVENAYESYAVTWFVTKEKVYLTKTLNCRGVFCFIKTHS